MKAKSFLAFVIAAVLLFSLCACGTPSSPAPSPTASTAASPAATTAPPAESPTPSAPRVTLYVVHGTTMMSEDAYNALFDGFRAAYPQYDLKTEVVGNFSEKIQQLVAANQIPDVFDGAIGDSEQDARMLMMPLNDFFNSPSFDDPNVTVKDSLTAGSDQALTYYGDPYMLPLSPGVGGIVVNDDMFQQNGWKIPTSWEDLLAVSEQIKAAGITPIAACALGSANYVEMDVWPALCLDAGGTAFQQQLDYLAPGAWNSPQAVASFDRIKQMMDLGIMDLKSVGMDNTQAQTAFLNGKYAMCLSGYWFEQEMLDQMGDHHISFIPFPSNSNGSTTQYLNGWFNGIGAKKQEDPAKQQAVYDYLRYYCSYEFMSKLIKNFGVSMISNKRAMDDTNNNPDASYFTKSVAKVMANPNVTIAQVQYQSWYWGAFRVPFFQDLLVSLMKGDITPQQAADQAEAKMEELRNDPTVPKHVPPSA